MVGNGPRGDPQQPGDKRNAAPFEFADSGQGFAENLGRQILGLVPVADAANDVGIDAMEVAFVKLVEARRIALRGFHPLTVILVKAHSVSLG